jgi:type II secretory pathway pseudopilin PulG
MNAALRTTKASRRHQRGYAYIMALLLATIMMISMAAAIPNMLTEGRREKEQNMVWRGNQYKRGIRRFVQALGRYPTSLDDLTKPQNGIRYMRQAYKDPMNADDGKWRFIYVTSAGALVGSTRYTSLQQLALADQNGGVLPPPPANGAGALGMGFGAGTTASDSSANAQQNGSNPPSPGATVASPSATPPGSQTPGSATTPNNPFSSSPGLGDAQGMLSSQQAQPLSGDIIGGNIIGVGSTVDKPSIRYYRGGKKYKDWEFIYDPLTQTAIIGGQPGTGIPGATTPGQPANPQSNPFGGPTQAPPATTNPQSPGSTQSPGPTQPQ